MVLDNITVSMDDVRYMQQSCTAVVQTQNLGAGTLYVADSILSWLNPLGQGFKLEYPSIQLHAISRDTTTFPEHCLYLMVEGSIIGEELSSSDSEDRDPVAPISELRFVPDDKNALQDMYEAMCNAQALHPDAEDEESEDDGDWYGGGGPKGCGGGGCFAGGGAPPVPEGEPSNTVFIGDLPLETDPNLLTTVFGPYGSIVSHKILNPGTTGGAAIISFQTVEEAKWLVENLNGNIPQGLQAPIKVRFKVAKPAFAGGKGMSPY